MATVSTAYPAQLAARTAQRTPVAYISGSTADNNGGTIVTGGTIANTDFAAKSVKNLARNNKATGTYNVQNTELGSIKAKSDRNFGTQVAGTYIIPKVTSTIGGISSTVLQTNGSKVRRGLHFVLKDHATLDVTRGWDYVSGQHATLPSASTVVYPAKDGSTLTGVDKATQETKDAPGRITYGRGGAAATSANYPARPV